MTDANKLVKEPSQDCGSRTATQRVRVGWLGFRWLLFATGLTSVSLGLGASDACGGGPEVGFDVLDLSAMLSGLFSKALTSVRVSCDTGRDDNKDVN